MENITFVIIVYLSRTILEYVHYKPDKRNKSSYSAYIPTLKKNLWENTQPKPVKSFDSLAFYERTLRDTVKISYL